MAFKKSTEGYSNNKRRKVLRENYTNSRSEYDRPIEPVYYLPKFMEEDYQKSEFDSKGAFLSNLQEHYINILKEKKESKVYDTFYFGKLKGKPLSTFGDGYHKSQSNYIKWCLYTKRNDKNFINSLCRHNEYAKTLATNTHMLATYVKY